MSSEAGEEVPVTDEESESIESNGSEVPTMDELPEMTTRRHQSPPALSEPQRKIMDQLTNCTDTDQMHFGYVNASPAAENQRTQQSVSQHLVPETSASNTHHETAHVGKAEVVVRNNSIGKTSDGLESCRLDVKKTNKEGIPHLGTTSNDDFGPTRPGIHRSFSSNGSASSDDGSEVATQSPLEQDTDSSDFVSLNNLSVDANDGGDVLGTVRKHVCSTLPSYPDVMIGSGTSDRKLARNASAEQGSLVSVNQDTTVPHSDLLNIAGSAQCEVQINTPVISISDEQNSAPDVGEQALQEVCDTIGPATDRIFNPSLSNPDALTRCKTSNRREESPEEPVARILPDDGMDVSSASVGQESSIKEDSSDEVSDSTTGPATGEPQLPDSTMSNGIGIAENPQCYFSRVTPPACLSESIWHEVVSRNFNDDQRRVVIPNCNLYYSMYLQRPQPVPLSIVHRHLLDVARRRTVIPGARNIYRSFLSLGLPEKRERRRDSSCNADHFPNPDLGTVVAQNQLGIVISSELVSRVLLDEGRTAVIPNRHTHYRNYLEGPMPIRISSEVISSVFRDERRTAVIPNRQAFYQRYLVTPIPVDPEEQCRAFNDDPDA